MTGNEFYTTIRWTLKNVDGVKTLKGACKYMLWYQNDVNFH